MADELILGTSDVAKFFDTTSKTILKWKEAGCPQVKRGQWNLKDVFIWWRENIATDPGSEEDETLAEARRRYWAAKAGNEELKEQQTKGELISKDDVVKQWSQRMAEFKNGCFNLVSALPPLLEGKSQSEMRQIIYDFVWKMFDNVCRTGKFCPATPKQGKKVKND